MYQLQFLNENKICARGWNVRRWNKWRS